MYKRQGNATDGPGYPANPGHSGTKGTASGGDININGNMGGYGGNAPGGVTQNDYGINAYGGEGGHYYYDGTSHMSSPTSGNQAFIRFYRGNTNLPLDQLNAQNITGLMLEMSQLAQEQTSMLINADVSH